MEGLILDDVEEEEDNAWSNQISGRNCILFLVDARKTMFFDTNTSYFKQSMLCVRDAMLDLAKKQRGDLIGVVLYCTKLTEGKYAPDNVAILQDLTVPSVPVIKKFNEMIEDDFKQFRAKYGDVKCADLTRAVNYCQIVIHLCKMKLYLKNIVFMTCDDNPCGDDEVAAFRARKQANELYLHQIEFDVVSFGEFDSSKLFKELVLTSRGELLKDWENKDPVLKIEGVQNQIERLTQKFTRRLSFFRIGCERSRLVLQVSLFKLFTEPRKFITTVKNIEKDSGTSNIEHSSKRTEKQDVSKKVDENALREDTLIQREKNGHHALSDMKASTSGVQQKENSQAPKANMNNQEKDSEEQAEKGEMNPYLGRKVFNISKTELKQRISAQALNKRRGFQLIGFVQTVDVPLFFNTGEPYFVVPYGRNKNNRIAFSHLLQKCREREVSMFGWFCLTKSASPTLSIVHPLNSSTDGKGHPEGFLLTKIPYEDDLFEFDEAETAINHKPSEQQLEAAKKIVSKLTLPYNVTMFNDGEYLARIAMIEALAMDYSDVPEIEDNTDIDLKHITDLLGELNKLFIDRDNSNESFNTAVKGSKRSAGNTKSDASKHRKFDLMEIIMRGQANKLTVTELREVLKAEGVKSLSSMNKPRLVEIATRRFCTNSEEF